MASFTTFYLSRVIGKNVYDINGEYIGVVKDLLVDADASNHSLGRPLVNGILIKVRKRALFYSFQYFSIQKVAGKMKITCSQLVALPEHYIQHSLYLAESILDKQIVDINGHKLVRVNDVRLVQIDSGTFAVAVDIGIEGLLRRIGIAKPLKKILSVFGVSIPAKFILWEDVDAIDSRSFNIKLSKSNAKLHTLHSSDLADIIEELGKKSSTEVFSSLDEEKAADVMEELETDTQVHLLETLSIEKAADILDKMPADEVADILEALEDDRAEKLLNEMEKDTSQEVRDLLVYPENSVGSIMSTEVLSFDENLTVDEVLANLRNNQPEAEALYILFVTNSHSKLVATFSLRDLVVSLPDVKIKEIMKRSPVHLHDYQQVDDIAEIISKYNLLAIPVVSKHHILEGMVVIDDVVEDLLNERRTT